MRSIQTRLTRLLGLDVPIVQAPMSAAATPALVAAVSNAGGLGLLSGTWRSPEDLQRVIADTRARTERPFGMNLGLAWDQHERMDVCLAAGVKILSLFNGDPTPYVARAHAAGAVVLHTVASAAEARAVVDAGVDVVVAQGWEAGGHLFSEVGALALVPAVADAVPAVPVIAAGGIADGRGLAAVLALGADGAWMGTRFLLAEEAELHPHYRRRLVDAVETETVFSSLFDRGWPDAPHRALRNATIDGWEAAGRPEPGARPGEGEVVGRTADGSPIPRYDVRFPRPGTSGDVDAMVLYAGQGVALVRSMEPAASIVESVTRGALDALERVHPARGDA